MIRLVSRVAFASCLVATTMLVGVCDARAQGTGIDLQLFLPTAGPGATFTIDRPEVPRHLTYSVGLDYNVATGLLVRESDGADIVDLRNQVELLAAIGFFEWLELGLAIPAVFSRVADDPFLSPPLTYSTHAAFGDVRLSMKVPILRGDFAMAGRVLLMLPTGDADSFAGTDFWSLQPSLLLAYTHGIWRVSSELGVLLRRGQDLGDLEYDDELNLAAGVTAEIVEDWWGVAEMRGRVGVGGDSIESNQNSLEMDFGVRFRAAKGFTLDFGVGTGVVAGYGSPTFRAFLIARYGSEREPCVAGPEDFDGYEDGDFCADPDNDQDGIEDEPDDCPNDAEDMDGFLDEDGCPDTDNDADGIRDDVDECPLLSEDRDGYQDQDGCPERDNDEDGIADGVDQCPMEPEDRDGYQDEDGCPEPGPNQAVITVTDTRILISERIYYEFDSDVIRDVSLPLLTRVAGVIRQLPRGRRVRVEGYSDSAGNPQYNLDLSYRRARAVVEYLRSRGVPRDRVEYVGYGIESPVAPNDSPEGRALNRRVEFTILQPGERSRGGRARRRGGRGQSRRSSQTQP